MATKNVLPLHKTHKMNRAITSMLGGAVGDALGKNETFPCSGNLDVIHQKVLEDRIEFKLNPITEYIEGGPWTKSGFVMEKGEWTDDTSMMLCLSDSILNKETIDVADLMMRFQNWWVSGYNSCRGISVGLGGNTRKALHNWDPKDPYKMCGGTNPDKDAGNGSLMRLAPVPIYWSHDLSKAMEMSRIQTSTTHNVLEALDGSALMTFIIWHGINGSTKSQIFGMLDSCPNITHEGIKELILPQAPWRQKNEHEIRSLPGRCLWSLEAALWCVYKSNNFRDALEKAIALCGDSDTIGSITGQIAGAVYGASDIPVSWITGLKHHYEIMARAEALYKHKSYNKTSMDLKY